MSGSPTYHQKGTSHTPPTWPWISCHLCWFSKSITGVHQGDNMSPVLFLFVIQAFLDTLQMKSQPIQYGYSLKTWMENTKTCKGRLLSQYTTAKGTPFFFSLSFYVDDSFFVFQNCQELQQAIIDLDKHFKPEWISSKTNFQKTSYYPIEKSPLVQQIQISGLNNHSSFQWRRWNRSSN